MYINSGPFTESCGRVCLIVRASQLYACAFKNACLRMCVRVCVRVYVRDARLLVCACACVCVCACVCECACE